MNLIKQPANDWEPVAKTITQITVAKTMQDYGRGKKEYLSNKDFTEDAIILGSSSTIGTLGHVGHGKTTLTAAITTILAKDGCILSDKDCSYDKIDNAIKEHIGSMPINYYHIEYRTENRFFSHFDCPEHADYVKCLVSGTIQLDGAIVVVAATDGVMPQTREHILLARQVNVPRLVIFLNMCDSPDVDDEMIELVEMDVRDLLNEYDFDGENTPIIKGSALGALQGEPKWEDTVRELMNAVDEWMPQRPKYYNNPFVMPIEDVFHITGRGSVAIATGRIASGGVKVGDEVQIRGLDNDSMTSVVVGIEMFRRFFEEAEVGDNVGLLLHGIDPDTIKHGMVVCNPDVLPHEYFKASVYVLMQEEGGSQTPFHNRYRPQFNIRTIDVNGEIILPAGVEMVKPGDIVEIYVKLISPIVFSEGMCFAVQEGNCTVGLGHITGMLDAEEYSNYINEHENYVAPEVNDEEEDVGHDFEQTTELDKDEQEYLEALKEFLEEGEISDRERRMLDRVRKSLGISEHRAAELETSLKTPQLTEDEQEYLDMYREYAEEGEITEKVRKRLDRFASAIGISPKRMNELETM